MSNWKKLSPLDSILYANARNTLELATQSQMTVLLTGPTGCGKSHLAQWIHSQSQQSHGPFLSVNLATLHEQTLESELFGHERGAFTGADQKKMGLLEMAQGGTVFLDEISEIPGKLQARLLEFLQNKTILPLGARKTLKIDVRVIAASNRDLQREVKIGNFREDLYYRLRVLWIKMQGLNELSHSFGEIVHEILEELCVQNQTHLKRLTPDFVEAIERYGWPGNIRELRHVLEAAVLSARGEEVGLAALPDWFRSRDQENEESLGKASLQKIEVPLFQDYHLSVSRFEELYLSEMLKRCRGRVNLMSRTIGLNKGTLIKRLKAYQLKLPSIDSTMEVEKRLLA